MNVVDNGHGKFVLVLACPCIQTGGSDRRRGGVAVERKGDFATFDLTT